MEKKQVICEMEVTLQCIGGKYKALILEYLIDSGVKRFGEIKKYIQGISHKTLTNQLRELENDGLIGRRIYSEVPPKVEYYITEKGKTLAPILELMCEWGYDHFDDQKYELIHPQCQ